MNSALVEMARSSGVSFVCASCTRFWAGMQHGFDVCMAAHLKKPCAGPMKGTAFPEYDGPLKGHLHKMCFVCGSEPTGVVKMPDNGMVGICDEHEEMLGTYSAGGDAPPFVTKKTVDMVK